VIVLVVYRRKLKRHSLLSSAAVQTVLNQMADVAVVSRSSEECSEIMEEMSRHPMPESKRDSNGFARLCRGMRVKTNQELQLTNWLAWRMNLVVRRGRCIEVPSLLVYLD
jgi:hypothetical protein